MALWLTAILMLSAFRRRRNFVVQSLLTPPLLASLALLVDLTEHTTRSELRFFQANGSFRMFELHDFIWIMAQRRKALFRAAERLGDGLAPAQLSKAGDYHKRWKSNTLKPDEAMSLKSSSSSVLKLTPLSTSASTFALCRLWLPR